MELETGFEKVIGMDGEITGIRKHGLIYIVIEDFKEYQTHCTQDKILKVFTSKTAAEKYIADCGDQGEWIERGHIHSNYAIVEFNVYNNQCRIEEDLSSVAGLDDFTAEEFADFCRSTFE